MPRIKHIEIAGVDGAALRDFYSQLFGWEVLSRDVGGNPYYDVNVPGPLTAGIRHEPKGPPEIVVYVEVSDLDESVEAAVALGAAIRIPPLQHGELRFALIRDPEGNPVGLIQSDPEDGGSAT